MADLTKAVQKLIPSSISSINSGSTDEVDLRFLETAESVLLSLVNDPESAYYLAYRIAQVALSEIDTLLFVSDALVSLLQTDPVERIDPPAIDRDFSDAREALNKMLSRVSNNAAPEPDDVDTFVERYSLFARRQLLPFDQQTPIDQYARLLSSYAETIGAKIDTLLRRLEVLHPDSFFVDSLADELPSYKTLASLFNRVSLLLDAQERELSSEDNFTKASKALDLLNEVAATIALIKTIRIPPFLRQRQLTTVHVTAKDGIGPKISGSVFTDALYIGELAGAVPIHPTSNSLTLRIGSPGTDVTVTLPTASKPANLVLDRTGAGSSFDSTTLFSFSISVYFDTELVTYSASFSATQAAASNYVDIANYMKTVSVSPDKAGYPSITLATDTAGDEALFLVSATSDVLTLTVNDPSSTNTNYWSVYGEAVKATAFTTDVATINPYQETNGSSVNLSSIKSAIETALTAAGISNTVAIDVTTLSIQTHSVVSTEDSYDGRLLVIAQPQGFGSVVSGAPINLLGLPTSEAFGQVKVLEFKEDLTDLPVTYAYTDLYGKVELDKGNNSLTILEPPFPSSSFFEETLDLYSKGALSYKNSIEPSLQYKEAFKDLLRDVQELEFLLGRALDSSSDRKRALNYVLRTLGTSSGGPLASLKSVVNSLKANESSSMAASLSLLEERGFDAALEELLLGNVREALSGAISSYEQAIRKAFQSLGLGIEI